MRQVLCLHHFQLSAFCVSGCVSSSFSTVCFECLKSCVFVIFCCLLSVFQVVCLHHFPLSALSDTSSFCASGSVSLSFSFEYFLCLSFYVFVLLLLLLSAFCASSSVSSSCDGQDKRWRCERKMLFSSSFVATAAAVSSSSFFHFFWSAFCA